MEIYLAIVFLFMGIAIFELFDIRSALSEMVMNRKKKKAHIQDDKTYEENNTKLRKFMKRKVELMEFTKTPLTVFLILMGVSVFGGFLLGQYMFHDMLLSSALMLGFTAFPFLYLDREASNIKMIEAQQLENSMSMVTTTYLANNDIVAAIRDSIPLLEYPKPFESFMIETTYFDCSIDNALQHMISNCPNKFFIQWVDTLILAQSDKNQANVLPTIVDQMNEHRRSQIEANTSMVTIWMEYFALLSMVCLFPLIFKFISAESYQILIDTKVGKILMLGLIASILYSLKRAVSINKPLGM